MVEQIKPKPIYLPNSGFMGRHAVDADADAIADIYNYYVKQGGYVAETATVPRSTFYKSLKQSSLWVDVAENAEHKIIAWASYGQLYPFTNMAMLQGYAAPDYVNKNILVDMMARSDEVAKFLGWDSFIVCISSLNKISLWAMEQSGFKVCGTIKDVRVGKGDKFDQIWLQRVVE
jgi:L-amino acid N-acyltransferase YncA